VHSSHAVEYDFRILEAVLEVNEEQKLYLLPKIKAYFGAQLAGKHFAIWGLSFKPNTDDVREAPALDIVKALQREGATVTVFDPEAMNNARKQLDQHVKFAETQYECLQGADALVIATEWNEFRTPDFEKIEQLMKSKAIFDGRNLFDIADMEARGFHYASIGRKTVG
jgi:UDPglucose 6-dehydrogenase